MADIDAEAVLERLRAKSGPLREPPRTRRGRRQTAATRRKLRAVHLARQRRETEADPDAPPLKRARLAAGYSWRTLAEAAAVSRNSIARAEAGRPVGDWTWLRLARALGVKPDDIRP